MTRLEQVMAVVRGCQLQWVDLAQKHADLSRSASAPLTRDHHWREEKYWQGKADGIRFVLEQIQDAGAAKEVVS